MQRRRRSRFLPSPAQLALPLDYSLSARAVPSRSRARSKARQRPWPQVHPATSPAMHGRLGSVPATWEQSKPVNSFRQPQRFLLTSVISTLIGKVNGKRWPYAATLSPLFSRQVALVSDRSAHERGGGVGTPSGLSAGPTANQSARAVAAWMPIPTGPARYSAAKAARTNLLLRRERFLPAARCPFGITYWQLRSS